MTQKSISWNQPVPTANIAVSKSRVKLYTNKGQMPTYYLQKGQEFQIELFNPTTDDILAKIYLNNKIISQGGLVLRPGQRVFLERFLDTNAKFLFDTYEVSGSDEVKAAIRENGDFRVEFHKAKKQLPVPDYYQKYYDYQQPYGGSFGGPTWINGSGIATYNSTSLANSSTTLGNGNITLTSSVSSNPILNISASNSSSATLDMLSLNADSFNDVQNLKSQPISKSSPLRSASAPKKKILVETGRVEQGSKSSQQLTTVNKEFEYSYFHKVEAKLLPNSQKINTVEDLNVKKYCTNCGAKLAKGDKFCSQCGTKA